MGVLVDEHYVGPSDQDRVDVHLVQDRVPVLDLLSRHHLEITDLIGGLGATVRLDEPDDDIGAAFLAPYTLTEHLVGLADPRRCTEVDAQ